MKDSEFGECAIDLTGLIGGRGCTTAADGAPRTARRRREVLGADCRAEWSLATATYLLLCEALFFSALLASKQKLPRGTVP